MYLVSHLTDILNAAMFSSFTCSAAITLQNDSSSAKNYKMFSCASNLASDGEKENNPPNDEGSDPLVTADNTTCEEFSHSEDDTLNGNKQKDCLVQVCVKIEFNFLSISVLIFINELIVA